MCSCILLFNWKIYNKIWSTFIQCNKQSTLFYRGKYNLALQYIVSITKFFDSKIFSTFAIGNLINMLSMYSLETCILK